MSKTFKILTVISLFFGCDHSTKPPDGKFETPKIVWSFPNSEILLDAVQPAIVNGKTYIAFDSTLGCFDLSTGSKIWITNLGNSSSIASRKILVTENVLYLNHSSWVKAFNKLTGEQLWLTQLDPLQGIDLSLMTQNQSHLFLGRRGDVFRIIKSSGDVDLIIPLDSLKPAGAVQNAYDPLVSTTDNFLYIPTGYYIPDSKTTDGNIFCYNATTGEYIWGYQIPNRRLIPGQQDSISLDAALFGCTIKDNLVIFGAGQMIIALNRFTGQVVWEKFFNDDGFDLMPVANPNQDIIYYGSLGGYFSPRVYAIRASTGEIIWTTSTHGGSITTLMSLYIGRLYFCDIGKLYIVDAASGNILWSSYPPEHQTDRNAIYESSVAVGEGYMVNVGSKNVYCLTLP